MGLSRALLPVPKAKKSRISITKCTNADGSDKHPPHFVEEREREFSRFQRDGKEYLKMRMDIEQENSLELRKFVRRAIGVVAKEMDASLIQLTFDDFDTQTHNYDTGYLITNSTK